MKPKWLQDGFLEASGGPGAPKSDILMIFDLSWEPFWSQKSMENHSKIDVEIEGRFVSTFLLVWRRPGPVFEVILGGFGSGFRVPRRKT